MSIGYSGIMSSQSANELSITDISQKRSEIDIYQRSLNMRL